MLDFLLSDFVASFHSAQCAGEVLPDSLMKRLRVTGKYGFSLLLFSLVTSNAANSCTKKREEKF